ncbi:MAG TPA: hypothetical protein VFM40_03260 [Actinomycetota bacterium]|nr:hypothetical protein [Actinomycetota bacterium]
MDRDTLMDDLDLILERSRYEVPGEWDWEPPLGTGAVAISASEPSDAAMDGPDDETDDETDEDADNEGDEDE